MKLFQKLSIDRFLTDDPQNMSDAIICLTSVLSFELKRVDTKSDYGDNLGLSKIR